MRVRFFAAAGTAALALAGSVLAASPALAACSGICADTPVTFTLSAGALTITAPSATATLTQAAGTVGVGGTSVSGQLGSTVVTDARGTLVNAATVVMTSSP